MAGIERASSCGAPYRAAEQGIVRVMDGSIGESGRRHPVGRTLAYTERVLVADAGIAGESYVGAELERVLTPGPGEVVQQVVNRGLGIVAVDNPGVEPVEDIPFLARISQNSRALTSEAPVQRVD